MQAKRTPSSNPRQTGLSGLTFGRWFVLGLSASRQPSGKRLWVCRCICDPARDVDTNALKSGRSQGCGCISASRNYRWDTPEYRSWKNMIARCTKSSHNRFHRYGGRGIKVCQRWLDSLEAFIADMGPCPAGHSIDRIDNNGDYEPTNCRWSDVSRQANNKSSSRMIEYDGRSMSIAEWSSETGIDYFTLHSRIKRGWSVVEAINTPPGECRDKLRRLGLIPGEMME